jgi:hypothetical protein
VKADVLLARCQQGRGAYGIRVEEGRGSWFATWTFPVDESQFARSGYGKAVRVKSGLDLADTFRGCPYCEANSFVQCGGCRHLTCHRDGARTWQCGWPPCQVLGRPGSVAISTFDGGFGG